MCENFVVGCHTNDGDACHTNDGDACHTNDGDACHTNGDECANDNPWNREEKLLEELFRLKVRDIITFLYYIF